MRRRWRKRIRGERDTKSRDITLEGYMPISSTPEFGRTAFARESIALELRYVARCIACMLFYRGYPRMYIYTEQFLVSQCYVLSRVEPSSKSLEKSSQSEHSSTDSDSNFGFVSA